jgi:hypothetical protein
MSSALTTTGCPRQLNIERGIDEYEKLYFLSNRSKAEVLIIIIIIIRKAKIIFIKIFKLFLFKILFII